MVLGTHRNRGTREGKRLFRSSSQQGPERLLELGTLQDDICGGGIADDMRGGTAQRLHKPALAAGMCHDAGLCLRLALEPHAGELLNRSHHFINLFLFKRISAALHAQQHFGVSRVDTGPEECFLVNLVRMWHVVVCRCSPPSCSVCTTLPQTMLSCIWRRPWAAFCARQCWLAISMIFVELPMTILMAPAMDLTATGGSQIGHSSNAHSVSWCC